MDFIIAIIVIGIVINVIKKAKQQNNRSRNTNSDPYQTKPDKQDWFDKMGDFMESIEQMGESATSAGAPATLQDTRYEGDSRSGSIQGFDSTEGECAHDGTHTTTMPGQGEGYSGEGYAEGTDQSDHSHSNPASGQTILQTTISSSMGDNMAHRLDIKQGNNTPGAESKISNSAAYAEKSALSNKLNQAIVYDTKTVGQIAAANVAKELRTAGMQKAIVYSELLKRPKMGVAPRYR